MAVLGMGTKLYIGSGNNPTAWVAELTEISGIELSADTVETTTLESADNYRTFSQSLRDAGEVSLTGFFNPDDTDGQYALFTNFNDGSVDTYQIIFPTALGAKWEFSGIVTGITTSAAMEDLVPFEATLKVTGKPTLTIS